MSFLNRGRPVFSRIGRPVAAVTGLPVAAPAPEGVTDDLRALRRMTPEEVEEFGARFADAFPVPSKYDGTAADRQWADAELGQLERLATLTERHGSWAAAQHMYGGTR